MIYKLKVTTPYFGTDARTNTPAVSDNAKLWNEETVVNIEKRIELLVDILAPWAPAMGADGEGYKNHCYRMLHFTQALYPCDSSEKHKLVIAAAHHDIGIWSAHTVDYLPPSRTEALRYLQAQGKTAWSEEVALMIDEHHKLTRFKDPKFPLVEAFRRGDLVDFSMGWLRQGVPAAFVREVQAAFPNAGFHKMLMRSAGQWFRQHPLSQPPFMKW